MTKKFIVADDQYCRIDGKIIDLKRRLRQKNGSPISPDSVETGLQDILEGKSGILKLISGDRDVIIDPCDGKELIKDAKDVFRLGINDEFGDPKYNNCDYSSPEVCVEIYQTQQVYGLKTLTLTQMLDFLEREEEELYLSQSQIINFCKKHAEEWMPQSASATFFIFKDDPKKDKPTPNFSYVIVSKSDFDDMVVSGRRLLHGAEHNISRHFCRLVVPKKRY